MLNAISRRCGRRVLTDPRSGAVSRCAQANTNSQSKTVESAERPLTLPYP